MKRELSMAFFVVVLLIGMTSCSVTKFVPDGSALLDGVRVSADDGNDRSWSYLSKYSYQVPNTRWFGLFRVPLGVYSMASATHPDRRIGRMLQNMGQAPVVYDDMMALASAQDMSVALVNQGYLNASVSHSVDSLHGKKVRLTYGVSPGRLFVVDTIGIVSPDATFASLLESDPQTSLLTTGMPLNSNILDEERTRIVRIAHRNAYYDFNKDHVSFVADTAAGSDRVSLNVMIDGQGLGHKYRISQLNYHLLDSQNSSGNVEQQFDTDDFSLYFPESDSRPFLKPGTIARHSVLRIGQEYNADSVSLSYQSLSRLGILKYSNISFSRSDTAGGLVADVAMMMRPKHSFGMEIEGTNTAGDLGAAASVSFFDRNLLRGAEQLSIKLRGAFESISNLPGYTGDEYLEYGVESSLSFPEVVAPALGGMLERFRQASTELTLKVNVQRRPEFQKTIFSSGWSYVWGDVWNNSHRFDVLDLNYLVVPWIDPTFQAEYLDQISSARSILKYNYEDLLITKLGYTFYRTNSSQSQAQQRFQYTVRAGVETSGNMFNLLSPALGLKENSFGQSMVMGIAFAQYLKHDFAFTAKWMTGQSGSLLLHAEWGIGVPYGNSTTLPFEKRYFAGGANGVRGWTVRGLGPGVYTGTDGSIDYIHQSGDVKLGGSVEYRSKLFWKLNGAAFVDAGNIWTIREYAEQPGGVFRFDEFYRQIAVSYGLGLRLDFNFLVLRLDGGMKVFNPAGATSHERLALLHPQMGRDFAFHLAVGYPF